MKIKFWFSVLCVFKCILLNAQVGRAVTEDHYSHIGAYHSKPSHALLARTNQALLPYYKQFTITAFGEKRFLLDDLSQFKLGLVVPVNEGAFSLQAFSFGSAHYNYNNIGFAYGRQLSDRMGVGVQFNYLQYHIAGYGNAYVVNAEAGVLYKLSESVITGLHIYNPTGQTFMGVKEVVLPRVVSVGFGYTPSETFYSSITLIKESNQPLNVQATLQYNILQKLVVKGGVTTATSQFYFGAGYQMNALVLEASATIHPQLGVSPALMITYKKKD